MPSYCEISASFFFPFDFTSSQNKWKGKVFKNFRNDCINNCVVEEEVTST